LHPTDRSIQSPTARFMLAPHFPQGDAYSRFQTGSQDQFFQAGRGKAGFGGNPCGKALQPAWLALQSPFGSRHGRKRAIVMFSGFLRPETKERRGRRAFPARLAVEALEERTLLSGSPVPAGPQFQVNTYRTGDQLTAALPGNSARDVAMDAARDSI